MLHHLALYSKFRKNIPNTKQTENTTAKEIQALEIWLQNWHPDPGQEQADHPEGASYVQGMQEELATSPLQKPELERARSDQGPSKQGQENMGEWASRACTEMDMIMGSRGNALLMTKEFLVWGGIMVVKGVMIAAMSYGVHLIMVIIGAGLKWARG
jgi:hypothetical protein